jgi:predicted NBD/HSP70 family sugar kinase
MEPGVTLDSVQGPLQNFRRRDAAAQANILAFDLGGTTIRAGFFCRGSSDPGPIVRANCDVVRNSASPIRVLEHTLASLGRAAGAFELDAVVLGVPGPVIKGTALRLPTLFPGSSMQASLDFGALASEIWPGVAIIVCNDLTAAGYRFIGEGFRDFLVLTIGSGVGSKLFIDARPLLGAAGHGGEIGHWRVPGAPPLLCDCGEVGHLGALASGRGAVRMAQARASDDPQAFKNSTAAQLCDGNALGLTCELLAEALHQDDGWTIAVLASVASALGAALNLCHMTTGIDRFLVTGGFAGVCGNSLRRMICVAAAEHGWRTGLDWDKAVIFAKRDEEHGVLGGAVLGRLALSGKAQCN